jgi:hypothetical protein
MTEGSENILRPVVQMDLPLAAQKGVKGFVKKRSGNWKGKPKGTLTRKTKILQAFTDDILTGGAKKFKQELQSLKGKSYVESYLALLEYCVPKQSRVTHEGNTTEIKIQQVFRIGETEITL